MKTLPEIIWNIEKQRSDAEPYQVDEQHAKPFNMKNNSIRNLLNVNSQAQINRGMNLQNNEQMGMQQPGMPKIDMSKWVCNNLVLKLICLKWVCNNLVCLKLTCLKWYATTWYASN